MLENFIEGIPNAIYLITYSIMTAANFKEIEATEQKLSSMKNV